MNVEQLWGEIEEELSWRVEELRFLTNRAAGLGDEAQREQFRRTLVLLLYAHFEGFCVFALRHFVKAVNSTRISCADAQPAIGAATLAKELAALRDPSSKSKLFKRVLPDDSNLHRFARDREFVGALDAFIQCVVDIPDDIVDSESNLKPEILRKNLYRLGLPHDLFRDIEGDIHRLLNMRNKIAHGERRAGVDAATFEKLKGSVLRVMNTVKREVMNALVQKAYLKNLPVS